MTIVKAKVLGFCGGVRRAVQMIETELAEHGPLHTLGAIVHNAHVVDALAKKGARMAKSLDEVPEGATVAITAHGAGEDVYEEIERRGLRLVDTTCPIVRRAQAVAERMVGEGFGLVLYGEAEHPEVRGILSWTKGKGIATQSSDVDVPLGPNGIAVISQTTKSPALFAEFAQGLVRQLAGRVPEIRIIDTTCPETGRRYQSAEELAASVDALIVVGSRTSANTRKLAETCRAMDVATFHIESAAEIDENWFKSWQVFGVTAGASTPDPVIQEVVRRLEVVGGRDEGLKKRGNETGRL